MAEHVLSRAQIRLGNGAVDPDHTREIDGAIAGWFAGIGVAATFAFLPDHGIAGNGHMMMLERNSADIAAFIADWIDTAVG